MPLEVGHQTKESLGFYIPTILCAWKSGLFLLSFWLLHRGPLCLLLCKGSLPALASGSLHAELKSAAPLNIFLNISNGNLSKRTLWVAMDRPSLWYWRSAEKKQLSSLILLLLESVAKFQRTSMSQDQPSKNTPKVLGKALVSRWEAALMCLWGEREHTLINKCCFFMNMFHKERNLCSGGVTCRAGCGSSKFWSITVGILPVFCKRRSKSTFLCCVWKSEGCILCVSWGSLSISFQLSLDE